MIAHAGARDAPFAATRVFVAAAAIGSWYARAVLRIVIACRRSPARLAGATCPIGTLVIEPPAELRWWDQDERTLRFLRHLEGVVTVETASRWGDFAVEYAALIAQAFDGLVGVADEFLAEVDREPAPISERDLAFAWRALDDRAQTSLEAYQQAMQIKHLAWDAPTAANRPTSRPLR